ncbi:GNAT family N-acetyltransferase [Aliirhizobium cellulosilyticum]|uniref:GNAT family N-acetyltransferase n=1 Tax=Aliirhizobium cellulosilyticum TaxID=393664 RepID=UPI0016143747|nr:GNAT family N-acetyltransferase [Rhizobium cellulosilyticum]
MAACAETWVATLDGQPAGIISLINTFIGGLFVSPCRQGLGIGRNLVSHALNLEGELSLEAYTENMQTVGFSRAIGFQKLSRRSTDDEGYPFENAHLRLVGLWQLVGRRGRSATICQSILGCRRSEVSIVNMTRSFLLPLRAEWGPPP